MKQITRSLKTAFDRRSFLGKGLIAGGAGAIGSAWVANAFPSQAKAASSTPPSPYNYTVYRDHPVGGTYYCQRYDGTVVASDPNYADPVIQAALNQYFLEDSSSGYGPGSIAVRTGNYVLSPGFSGFQVHSWTTLKLDTTARIIVPSGYAGAVFQLLNTDAEEVQNTTIDGGVLFEQNAQHQWTAFLLKGSAQSIKSGILFNKISNTTLSNAKIGVKLWVTTSNSFINSNTFEFLRMWDCEAFVDFQIDPSYQPGQQNFGIIGNHFFDLQCQSTAVTMAGIRNITGWHNSFVETKVWDLGKGFRANIIPQADSTVIVGGILAGGTNVFQDKGVNTRVFDSLYP
jgi:hypothetical protein